MYNIPIDELVKKVGSVYKLCILASRRAIELGEGAAKLIDRPLDTKPSHIAIEEILEDKITYKVKEGK